MANDQYTAVQRDGSWGVYAGWPVPAPPPWPWDVPPAGQFSNISLNTISEVAAAAGMPSTEGVGPMYNWSGATMAPGFGAKGGYIVFGSGHLAPNSPIMAGVPVFDLDTLLWSLRCYPSQPLLEPSVANTTTGWQPEFFESLQPATLGYPYTPHTYNGLIYRSPANGGGSHGQLWRNCLVSPATKPGCVHAFDLSADLGVPTRPIEELQVSNTYPCSALDEARGGYWHISGSGAGPLIFVRFADAVQTTYPSISAATNYGDAGMVLVNDNHGREYLLLTAKADSGGVNFGVFISVFTAGVPSNFVRVFPTGNRPPDARCSVDWATHLECLVCYSGDGSSVVHKLIPPSGSLTTGTWQWVEVTMTGVGGIQPARTVVGVGDYRGTYARMRYLAARQCFIFCDSMVGPVQAWNIP